MVRTLLRMPTRPWLDIPPPVPPVVLLFLILGSLSCTNCASALSSRPITSNGLFSHTPLIITVPHLPYWESPATLCAPLTQIKASLGALTGQTQVPISLQWTHVQSSARQQEPRNVQPSETQSTKHGQTKDRNRPSLPVAMRHHSTAMSLSINLPESRYPYIKFVLAR